MTSALESVQQALMTQLQTHVELMAMVSGIYDGPPARAEFPYLAMATGATADWSHKSKDGRELSLAMAVYDDGESASRLHRAMALVEEALAPGLPSVADWQIVTFNFRRTRILRSTTGPWTGLVEYRARCLKN